jgi:hypothetical protein
MNGVARQFWGEILDPRNPALDLVRAERAKPVAKRQVRVLVRRRTARR